MNSNFLWIAQQVQDFDNVWATPDKTTDEDTLEIPAFIRAFNQTIPF